ncbi:DPH4 homolog [Babesia caballi]|uniref:DPH4 homolog n=1 Tax=Babesia caballi TaxID=5871 RepID=A0AAV4LQM7_BABCB|nr:DPH4 homolog [Babesia caballi]
MGPQALKELVRAAGVLELQTEEKLDRAAVRRSFRRAVRTSHPDKSGGSVEVFNEVMWAYLTLNRYFDNKEHNGEATDAKGSTFHQPLSVVDMLYSEQDGAYFFQCRCGDVVEVATVALALEGVPGDAVAGAGPPELAQTAAAGVAGGGPEALQQRVGPEQALAGKLALLLGSRGRPDGEALEAAGVRDEGLDGVGADLAGGLVLANETVGSLGADALQSAAVVAPTQNAKINELVVSETEQFEHLWELDLEDLLVARRQVLQQRAAAEDEGVGVLSADGVGETLLHEVGALGLGLFLCLDHGHAHQTEQLFRALVLRLGDVDGAPDELANGLLVVLLLGLLQRALGLLPQLLALREGLLLRLGGGGVEHENGFYACLEEPDAPVHQPCDVGGGLALGVGERGEVAAFADGDGELIERGRGINAHRGAGHALERHLGQ